MAQGDSEFRAAPPLSLRTVLGSIAIVVGMFVLLIYLLIPLTYPAPSTEAPAPAPVVEGDAWCTGFVAGIVVGLRDGGAIQGPPPANEFNVAVMDCIQNQLWEQPLPVARPLGGGGMPPVER